MLPAFRGVQAPASADAVTLARLFNELVGQLRQVFARLLANASLDDVRVTGVVLTGGADTTVTHKLGRQPQEWRITDISAAATVFRQSWSATTLVLRASATCTVDLRVA